VKVSGLAGQAEGSWRGSVVIYIWNKLLPVFCLGMVHFELFHTKDKDWVSPSSQEGNITQLIVINHLFNSEHLFH
jgi:hypothetical protein